MKNIVAQNDETIEFRYSRKKLVKRMCAGVVILALGILAIFFIPLPDSYAWATIIAVLLLTVLAIGLGITIEPLWRLIRNGRVFLRLTDTFLIYYTVRSLTHKIPIPALYDTFIPWRKIMDIKLESSLIFGTSLIIILHEKKKNGRNKMKDFRIALSEYSPEYILQTVKTYL